MNDFEEHLREHLRRAAAEIEATPGAPAIASQRALRTLFLRRLAAAGVALAVAAGAAVAAVQLPENQSAPFVTVTASPTEETEPSPTPSERLSATQPAGERSRERERVPEANGRSVSPAISAEGLHIVYSSEASNLVPDDRNNCATTYDGKSCPDVFLRDLTRRRTERISVDSRERESHPIGDLSNLTPLPPPLNPVVSGKGGLVAFDSDAPDLVEGDTNRCVEGNWDGPCNDVFVRDRRNGTTVRASVTSEGEQRDAPSRAPAISRDGRFVAFSSLAAFVDEDTNDGWDIYVHDLESGETTRASVSSDGRQGNDHSRRPAISDDGRFVAFDSAASNLVLEDTNGQEDAFVHDRQTGETERVSVSSSGDGLEGSSTTPKISASGRYVVFSLFPEDGNGHPDVYIRDRERGLTELVSVSSAEHRGNASSGGDGVSDDGRFVVFSSEASNLVPGDTNRLSDVFLRDRSKGTTVRISLSSSEVQANGNSRSASISADGERVVFTSYSDNLVSHDTNNVCDPVYDDRQKRCPDIFLRYVSEGRTIRISIPSTR